MFKVLVFTLLCATTFAAKYNCSAKSALLIQKRPTYEFSVKLLDRVAQATYGHFVFSPISTYMQLSALAEGARGNTFKEIWKVTRHHRLKCFRRKWKWVLNRMDNELGTNSNRKSIMILDRLMGIKRPFIREVTKLKSMEVLLLDFNSPVEACDIANEAVSKATGGVIEDTFTPYDFNSTVLLMADTTYYRSEWQVPFNPVYTSLEKFYYGSSVGEVKMMTRVDYFHMADVALLKSQVLELPCGTHNKISMLIFLPYGDVNDVFFDLQRIRLMSIFNTFKLEQKKLVSVKLPRFKIRTDVDAIPELLYDMGVKSLFHPNSANLRGISDFKLYASLMTQVADIEVTEKGVRAGAVADFMVSDRVGLEFEANRPFAYMLVDRKTEIILFAGIYSDPSVY